MLAVDGRGHPVPGEVALPLGHRTKRGELVEEAGSPSSSSATQRSDVANSSVSRSPVRRATVSISVGQRGSRSRPCRGPRSCRAGPTG